MRTQARILQLLHTNETSEHLRQALKLYVQIFSNTSQVITLVELAPTISCNRIQGLISIKTLVCLNKEGIPFHIPCQISVLLDTNFQLTSIKRHLTFIMHV